MKNSIYGLTMEQLTEWLLERGHKNSVHPKYGIGCTKNASQVLRK